MEAKQHLLESLELQIEQARMRSRRDPDNEHAATFVKLLKMLHDDLSTLPADHRLFSRWQYERWAPVALSDSALMSDFDGFSDANHSPIPGQA